MTEENNTTEETVTKTASSLWGTIGKVGSSTAAIAIIGAIGSWTWNSIDRHDKELIKMREEIRVLQQSAAKTDKHDTDIGILKVVVGMRETVQ